MLLGIFILFLLWGLGEALSTFFELPVPGSVLGMALLTIALETGLIKARHVEQVSKALLTNLPLLFVPPGVGVMMYFGLLSGEWLPLGAALALSSFMVLFTAGWLMQRMGSTKGAAG